MQVLWRIPITSEGIPIYGFGMMLFLAFILCTWLAGRFAESEGISKETVQDLAIWVFIGGLLGARTTYLLNEDPRPGLVEFFRKLPMIWEGGIVLYGSIIGGTVSFFLAYFLIYRKRGLSVPRFLDAIAPAIALGIGLGRIGCLLNGCCFGQVACADGPVYFPAKFPLSAPCRETLVDSGAQTVAGFTLAEDRVQTGQGARIAAVLPGSPAYQAGLRPNARIQTVNGFPIYSSAEMHRYLGSMAAWPRGETTLTLTYQPQGEEQTVTTTISPRSLGLYPTQLYETISMGLLMLLLIAYWGYRKNPGQVIAVMMAAYGVHRFLNEMLRDDPRPKGFESYGSIFLMVTGLMLWIYYQLLSRSPGAANETGSGKPFSGKSGTSPGLSPSS